MSSIRTRKDSDKLMIDFRYQGKRFRRQSSFDDNINNRQILMQQIRKINAEKELGILDLNNYINADKANALEISKECNQFSHFANVWFYEKKVEWKSSYISQVEAVISQYLSPYFPSTDVKDITKAEILTFRNTLVHRGLSASRTNHIMSILRQVLNEASERLEFKRVFKNIKSLRIPKTCVVPFNLDEVFSMIKNAPIRYKNYLAVKYFTGLRTSEINGLKWKHIDFDNRKILVREVWLSGRIECTKNTDSHRDVDMCDLVVNAIQAQKELCTDSQFVFTNNNGKPIDNSNFTKRIWYPLLATLKLEKRSPYQTRHTCASIWLAAGEKPEWISKQLGHANSSMLFKVYSRFIPNFTGNDGDLFNRVLSNFSTNQPTEVNYATHQ